MAKTGIKNAIQGLLPSLYEQTKKSGIKPLDYGYDPSFLYAPKVKKNSGGSIMERENYAEGTPPKLTQEEAMQILKDIKDGKRNDIPRIVVEGKKIKKSELEKFKDAQPEGLLKGTIFDYVPDPHQTVIYLQRRQAEKRNKKAEGGEIEDQMGAIMEAEEQPMHTMPDGTEMAGANHEDYEAMMSEEEMMSEEKEMLPDDEMEDGYLDFVINESLSQEDEDYLAEKLSADDRLSMIFDSVIETASEFAGSGPVEGPGSSVSDSIPARLSDGEFVVTSKAANQIGPDNLQGLMEVAELEADEEERQMNAIGGSIKGDEAAEVVSSTVLQDDPINLKNKETMRALDPRLSLFAS